MQIGIFTKILYQFSNILILQIVHDVAGSHRLDTARFKGSTRSFWLVDFKFDQKTDMKHVLFYISLNIISGQAFKHLVYQHTFILKMWKIFRVK